MKNELIEKSLGLMQKDIRKCYEAFFRSFEIDKKSGRFAKDSRWSFLRFPTYPYIGSEYAKKKNSRVLFIGLDIGRDEKPNSGINDFSGRRNDVMKAKSKHVYGMMVATILLLKNRSFRNGGINRRGTYKSTIESAERSIAKFDPHPHFAMTNCYKFVISNSKYRFNSRSTKHISINQEWDLLLEEVRILKPKFVVLESRSFETDPWQRLLVLEIAKKNRSVKVYISNHPSYKDLHSSTMKYMRTFRRVMVKRGKLDIKPVKII